MGLNSDYSKIEDCFAKTKHISSTLIYGDMSAVPDPWLTVFIPTYRRADLLQQALDSVLKQWHTDFPWDIVVVDNEPYDGKANASERLIRKISSPRLLYYRNSKNMRPGDNFNRGIFLARGKWVTMLHDDDLMMHNALHNMGKLLKFYGIQEKELGAIMGGYVPFLYNPKNNTVSEDIYAINQFWCSVPTDYKLFKHSQNTALLLFWFGNLPSNASTFNRKAVIECGGFNESNGICADIILLYNMIKKYDVYSTYAPLGLYRIGCNVSLKRESIIKTVQGYDQLCNYIFSRNLYSKMMGFLFKENTYHSALANYINGINKGLSSSDKTEIYPEEFDYIHPQKASRLKTFFARICVIPLFNRYKEFYAYKLAKKAKRKVERL